MLIPDGRLVLADWQLHPQTEAEAYVKDSRQPFFLEQILPLSATDNLPISTHQLACQLVAKEILVLDLWTEQDRSAIL